MLVPPARAKDTGLTGKYWADMAEVPAASARSRRSSKSKPSTPASSTKGHFTYNIRKLSGIFAPLSHSPCNTDKIFCFWGAPTHYGRHMRTVPKVTPVKSTKVTPVKSSAGSPKSRTATPARDDGSLARQGLLCTLVS